MKEWHGFALTAIGVMTLAAPSQAGATYSGIVEQVWEDGFRLNTGSQVLIVDSYDLYGDNTASQIAVGDRVTITGEFEAGEFDAFTIVKAAPAR